MTPVDAFTIAATVTLTVIVFAAVGVGGGYLLSTSELFGDAQQRWARNADLLDAALNSELVEWETIWAAELERAATEPDYQPDTRFMPWGTVAGDTRVIGELVIDPGRATRFRWRAKWVWYAMLRCNICSGWHWIEGAAIWTVAWLTVNTTIEWWVVVAVTPIVWLAAGAVHTVTSAAINDRELW